MKALVSSAEDVSGNGYDASLSGSPSWEYSGAPVGNTSKYIYANTFNIGISSTQGDSINYEHMNGVTQGAHVYRIDSVPYNTSAPNPIIDFDTTHYWGVFTLGNASYETSYFYDGNAYLGTGNDCFIGMAERLDAYEEDWNNQGFTSVNYSSEVVTWTDSIRSENILGLSANGPHTFTFDHEQPTCFEDTDGSITVHVSGGESPYTFDWAAGSNDSTETNLGTGYHVFTVTDNNSCVSIDSFFLDEPMAVSGQINVTDASCALSTDGAMTVNPNGGSNSGYTYLWNNQNNSTTATISSLGVGSYTVTITDSEGCEGEAMASLTSIGPDPIPNLGPDTNVCGETTWGLTASVTNGPATSFAWSTGETGPIKIVTMTGTYSLTVLNSAGCEGRDTIEVTYVEPLQVELPNNGNGTGSYDIEASDGFLFYEWSTSATGQTITVNTSGQYSVTATDSNGCQSSDTINVTITPTGLDDLNETFSYRIWPNPVMEELHINQSSREALDVSIYDMHGRLITRKSLSDRLVNSIQVDYLEEGMYLIKITSNSKATTLSFIKGK